MAVGLRKRRRIQLVVAGAVLLAAATALVGYAMRDGIEFFRSPSQLAERPAARRRALPPRRPRRRGLGGARSAARCASSSPTAAPACRSSSPASRPTSSARARASIATGRLEGGTFVASEILAKHDESYMPKEVADALKEQGLFRYGRRDRPGS